MTAPRWAAGAAIAIAAACAPPEHGPRFRAANAAAPRPGGSLRLAYLTELRTLDPAIAYDEMATAVLHPLLDTLVDYAADGVDVVPGLAERWTVSADGLRYAFTLRAGPTFADGAPITAAHVAYALERTLATPDSPFAEYLTDLVGAAAVVGHTAARCAGVTVVDDHHLELALTRPTPALLAILAMPFTAPQRPDHVARAGDQLRRQPDASGPFVLAEWDEGNRVVLRRNPAYRGARTAWVDELVIYENVPRELQFARLVRGELDAAAPLAIGDFVEVTTDPAWQPSVHRVTGLNAFGTRIDVQRAPFTDRRVRQALNYALDKAHTARLLSGTTSAAHGVLPPGIAGRDPTLAPYPHDPARARSLLAAAGFPAGLDVDYLVPADEETEKVIASLQADLAEVGVRVHLRVRSWSAFQAELVRDDGPPLAFASWAADFPDASNFLDAKFGSRAAAGTNDAHYRNPALDRLLDDARATRDPAARAAIYRAAERILYDDAPWIWDYHRVQVEVTQPYVRGHQLHPIWLRDFTSAWLDLGPDGQPVPR